MTEYEIADLTTSVMANYLTAFTVFVTLISAYVVTAFVAGKRLSRAQVAFINACFIVVTTLASLLCAMMMVRALALNLDSPLADLGGPKWGPRMGIVFAAMVHAPLIVGCIWFMHKTRRDGS